MDVFVSLMKSLMNTEQFRLSCGGEIYKRGMKCLE